MGVRVNLTKVKRKLSQSNMDRGRYAMANQMLADMNQFVPAKDYNLRNQSTVLGLGTSIVWNAPYAHYQFVNQFSNYTTPGTGPRWDLKAKALYMDNWINAYIGGAGIR